METILISTDFSSAARNATTYGFELAKAMGAKVILFTAYHVPTAFPESSFYLTPQELEKDSYKLLMDEAELLDPKRTVALVTKSMQGPVNDSIIAAALENSVSYIVLGMKERGKELRKYLGSTVTDLCKRSPVALVVVPAGTAFSIPATIALASDITDKTNLHILQPLKNLGERFSSKLVIIRVIKKSIDQVVERVLRPEALSSFLAGLQPTFEFAKGGNVANAITRFVQEQSIDMVAVIPHEHTLFERLFTRSVTKDLVFHTQVPLLVLPFETSAKDTAINEESYNPELMFEAQIQ